MPREEWKALRGFVVAMRAYRAARRACQPHSAELCLSLRYRLRLSRREMARRLGYSEAWICHVERGRKPASAALLLRLYALARTERRRGAA